MRESLQPADLHINRYIDTYELASDGMREREEGCLVPLLFSVHGLRDENAQTYFFVIFQSNHT